MCFSSCGARQGLAPEHRGQGGLGRAGGAASPTSPRSHPGLEGGCCHARHPARNSPSAEIGALGHRGWEGLARERGPCASDLPTRPREPVQPATHASPRALRSGSGAGEPCAAMVTSPSCLSPAFTPCRPGRTGPAETALARPAGPGTSGPFRAARSPVAGFLLGPRETQKRKPPPATDSSADGGQRAPCPCPVSAVNTQGSQGPGALCGGLCSLPATPIWGLRGQPTPHRASAARGLPAWTPRGDGAAPAGAPPVWRNNAALCPALSQRLRSGGGWALGCVTFVSKHHLCLFSDYEGHGALTLWGRPQTRYLRKQTWERRQRPSLKANYFVL